jgi:flagellar biosynthesis/type III secretory pathway protein FliH
MHPHHAAFLEYRVATSLLSDLPLGQQVVRLKWELLHALQRGSECQSRSRSLELDIDRLKAETEARAREHQAFSAQLHRELVAKARELALARAEGQEKLDAMHREVATMQAKCEALDELCKSLLLTLEDDADRPDQSRGAHGELRVSA